MFYFLVHHTSVRFSCQLLTRGFLDNKDRNNGLLPTLPDSAVLFHLWIAAAGAGALRICNQLRDRMYARLLCWQDAAPTERANLVPMDYDQYTAWGENARLARMEYLDGKLTAEEFLRRIDMNHELKNYETDKVELVDETVWQRMVANELGFDAEKHHPETMQALDLGAEVSKWELRTTGELRREDQKGHQSLRGKYGKG